MFNFSEWVVSGIIYGYNNNYNSFSKTTELTSNYLIKGIITEEQAKQIAIACPEPTVTDKEEL